MKKQCNIQPGTIINGKWRKQSYKVIRKLGEGANGVVYLVEHNGQSFALKISDNVTNITSEMNVLKSFTKVQGSSLGPYLLHGDDWIRKEGNLPFYIMEYIQGKELLEFIKMKGEMWVEILMLQLLTNLGTLHEEGWVFGDLKPENLLVTSPAHQIRCVDVGGTTQVGRSIKEFTEFFDRGYWGLGSRKAEPSYDLFAVAMIFINAFYPNRFKKNQDPQNQLINIIEKTKGLFPYKHLLVNALLGKYQSAMDMRRDLLMAVQLKGRTPSAKNGKMSTASSGMSRVRSKKKSNNGETVFILVLVCCLYGLYLYTQIIG